MQRLREERIDCSAGPSDAGILRENTGRDVAVSGKINQTHNLLSFSFISFFIYFYVLLIFSIFASPATVHATPDAGLTAANQKRLGHLGVAPLTGPQLLPEHYKSSFSVFFSFLCVRKCQDMNWFGRHRLLLERCHARCYYVGSLN